MRRNRSCSRASLLIRFYQHTILAIGRDTEYAATHTAMGLAIVLTVSEKIFNVKDMI